MGDELTPDYTAMDGHELLKAVGDDASKWAAAWCQIAKKLGHGDIDEGWMTGWFANAIVHSSDVRRWRREAATRPQRGSEMTERKIITQFLYPPIPIRQFDWVAYVDGDEQGPTGSGATEQAAVLDLEEILGLCPHCKREEADGMGCMVAGCPLGKDM